MKRRKFSTSSQAASASASVRGAQESQSLARLRPRSNSKLPLSTTPSSRHRRRPRSRGHQQQQQQQQQKQQQQQLFESFDSLFDRQKPVEEFLSPYPSPPPLQLKELRNSSEEDLSDWSGYPFGRVDDFISKFKPIFSATELEPHLVLPSSPSPLQNSEEVVEPSVDSPNERIIQEQLGLLSDTDEEISIIADMEDEEATGQVAEGEEDAGEVEPVENAAEEIPEEEEVETSFETAAAAAETTRSSESKGDEKSPKVIAAPSYPLPPGVGEGIVVGEGKNRDSIMSTLPFTDACVIEEIMKADERVNVLRKEIQDLKKIMDELTNKESLSEADTLVLKDTQAAVMVRVGELNEITRKLERTIGLVDPSTQTFAKMFEMLPYPHRPGDKKDEKTCEKICEKPRVCEKFAFPQIDYPEDKLPRVIICGNTEENFPKIVVADSRPKSRGKKCIQDLAGKLTESLSLQEKLAKENAQLEGGKYKLEKEILEKDDTVECLQRKICGLQAEIRIFRKENCELNRKVVCLEEQQQQQQRQLNSCSPCSQKSAVATPRSPCLSPRQPECSPKRNNDLSCKCSIKEPEQQLVRTPPGCTSRNSSPCNDRRPLNCSRLSGGASKVEDDCYLQFRQQDMFSRNAASSGCQPKSPPPSSRGEGICPAEIDERLAAYGSNTKYLADQLTCIEMEVRTMQAELQKTQRERQQLEQQRKLLECANPCAPCVCCPEPTCPKVPSLTPKFNQDSAPCLPCSDLPDCAAQQLRDLREQYARLQDDYKNKLCEVSRLRTDFDGLRRETREAKEERERLEIKLTDAQERLRAVEAERNDLLGTKEQMIEQEQALLVARQRYREAQDELEELRTMIRDQAAQLDDYRNKYLQAQQIVEEQRRQLDLMEMDNARMNENVTLEIGRVKSQFQEKLAELAPLPDILKQTQMKLQECQQLRILAEHNCEDLSRELLSAKGRIDTMQSQINDLQREIQALQDDKNENCSQIEELEKKNSELRTENERLKNAINRFEEQQAALQKRIDEKQHEIAQITAMLDQIREDSARQVSRTKERCEAIKRSMQAQISDFEIQLAQCRAAAKTAQKERDEIRHKMKGQIVNLNEALEQAQGRIRSLQGHVDYLKVSYSNVFGGQGQVEPTPPVECPTPGYDSCDCNY